MSKTLKAGPNNTKVIGTKQRESSKERSTARKVNGMLTENVNTLSKTKSKPAVKLKESPTSNVTTVKRNVKDDVNKTEMKNKIKQERNNISSTSTPTINKTSSISKSSTQSKQKIVAKSKRLTAPDTPPSSRVTKTQYFPSKKMYSTAVQEHLQSKANNEKVTSSRDVSVDKAHIKTNVIKRDSIKIIKNATKTATKVNEKLKAPEQKYATPHVNATNIERPRTATLRKGSIVNSNIAGPEIPKSETPSLTSLDLSYEQENLQESENDYEDDFDSYESDFEEYVSSSSTSLLLEDDKFLESDYSTTSEDISSSKKVLKQNTSASTDEERMLDSGNFDMPENKHKQLLDNIKESSEHEHFTIEQVDNNRSNMASLSDEGFEEGKSSLQSGNIQFINFAEAQKKWKHTKNLEKRKKRGEEILNMIRLDHYNFTLFDIPPVPYDVFIRSYGKTNTMQVSAQTGDDDVSEEIQTDTLEMINKWTQFPSAFTKPDSKNSNYLELYKQEYAGVGNDDLLIENFNTKKNYNNNKNLEKFLTVAGQTVLNFLDESLYSATERIETNSREIPFSNGYIRFNGKSFNSLKNRPITFIAYCPMTNIKILTVHGRDNSTKNSDENISLKSIVCIWSILNPEKPEKMLGISGDLNCCCFISEFRNIIGGLNDGCLTIWSLNDYNQLQTEALNDLSDKSNYLQEPTYTTEIDCGHACKVISIQQMLNATDDLFHDNVQWKSPNNQVCSLDENGTLIIWGIIKSSLNHTMTLWDQLALVQNLKLSLKDVNPDLTNLLCTDMSINLLDPHHIFISTNYGCVIHCSTTGTRTVPKKYNPVMLSQANCIGSCPFSPLYFFTGHNDGAIILYSRLLEKPLMVMSNKEDDTSNCGIELLEWSYTKPCVFYAKDRSNTIHVWDLTISDLYPIYSVPFSENITCMKLSPNFAKNDISYMVLATDDGSIHLHLLNPKYGPSNSEEYQQDVKKFLNYVSRL